MKPYNEEFIVNLLQEYNERIDEDIIGTHRIVKLNTSDEIIDGYLYKKPGHLKVPVIELYNEDNLVMRLDNKEIESTYEIIKFARGKVGIVGLGIGYVVQEMAKKEDVEEITVYEISEDVINLYEHNFEHNPKIKIIKEDAFKAKRKEFDYFYVDIYNYNISMRMVEDYKKFIELHKIKDYTFWGIEHFLLSCSYNEIVWVYIPETWMAMAKEIANKLSISGNMEYYYKLDEKLISDMLEGFKVILNEL